MIGTGMLFEDAAFDNRFQNVYPRTQPRHHESASILSRSIKITLFKNDPRTVQEYILRQHSPFGSFAFIDGEATTLGRLAGGPSMSCSAMSRLFWLIKRR